MVHSNYTIKLGDWRIKNLEVEAREYKG